MILRLGAASATLAVACGLGACSHDQSVACEPTTRYATAATAGPVRIPDDLNPPDETDSLRLPPNPAATVAHTKPCLESPPGYYADGAPAPARNGAGLQRRPASGGGQRPAAAPPPAPAPPPTPAPPPAAAPQPPLPAEPPPSDGAQAGGDREINN